MKIRYIIFGFICIAVLLYCIIDSIISFVRLIRFKDENNFNLNNLYFRSIVFNVLMLIGFFLGFAFYHCGVSLAII